MRNIEITENIIRGSIIYALNQKFGSSYCYYDEEIVEGFKRPSFHIFRITGLNSKEYTGNNYKLENNNYRYVIKYFSSEPDKLINDINDKIDMLKEVFKYLNIINIVPNEITGENDIYSKSNRVNEINYQTTEGVLLFEIVFDVRTMFYEEKDKVKTNTLVVGSNI